MLGACLKRTCWRGPRTFGLKMEPPQPTKILFVCAQNKIRSYTAERLFSASRRYQVRSRGISKDARIKLTEGDVGWADIIFVMEKNHKNRVAKQFREQLSGKKVVCLFIEDIYDPMDESLIRELRRKLAPHLVLPVETKRPSEYSADN